MIISSFSRLLLSFVLLFTILPTAEGQQSGGNFSITIDKASISEKISGRLLILVSKDNEFDVGENGIPVFGLNIDDKSPGDNITFNDNAYGYPVESLSKLPEGTYYVQSYLNLYTTFKRSDGHTVKLHDDRGEGHNWRRAPGNLFSNPVKVRFDPASSRSIELLLNNVIPPIPPRQDTKWVKNIRIKSELLTEFWGKPMYLGARILLPEGFDEHPDSRYPVHYIQGHFPRGNPGRFMEDGSNEFSKVWMSGDLPRFLLVTFEHACPYYDDSYGVNSANIGPYGDALVKELIPHIENEFRAIGKPYSRVLSGGSTGGWICLAQQVFYPEFFGGTWSSYPDQVDFRYYQIVNILEDENAYYTIHDWTKVPRPGARSTDGNIRYTMRQENHLEEALGDRYRSGGQWAVWNAVFAPVSEDGYPKPIWDPITGEIDHKTAQWAKENYDLRYYLEKNWSKIGKHLIGKIHMICGRMDNYYLNEGVYLLEEFLANTTSPYYQGTFTYGARGGHGWSPWGRNRHYIELTKVMAEHIIRNAPEGEDIRQWNYR